MPATEPASPATNLANLILALLAPMFLWSTNGNIRLAYTAAAQTVNEYRVTNRLSLFTVAKIIAFDIATLSSLSQSMYEDVSMLLALRLRGNANSLDRSGERNRRLLEMEQASLTAAGRTEEPVEVAVAKAEMMRMAKARTTPAAGPQPNAGPAPVAEPGAEAAPTARTAEEQHEAVWADATTCVDEEFAAGLEGFSSEERWEDLERIKALTTTAGELVSSVAPPGVRAMAAGLDTTRALALPALHARVD
jgi:hypothetical protein